jgi:hypothetical protein
MIENLKQSTDVRFRCALQFGSGMSLIVPCVEDLISKVVLFGGGRTFRRWELMGGI